MSLQVEEIQGLHLKLLAGAAVVAYLTGWVSPWSLLIGGAIMGVNFWLLRQAARYLLTGQRRPAVALGLLLARFTLLLGLLALLFWRLPLDGLAFAVGVTMLLVACVATAVRRTGAAA